MTKLPNRYQIANTTATTEPLPAGVTVEFVGNVPTRIKVASNAALRDYPVKLAERWMAESLPEWHLVPATWWHPGGPGFWGGDRTCGCFATIAYGPLPTERQWSAKMKPRRFDLNQTPLVHAAA